MEGVGTIFLESDSNPLEGLKAKRMKVVKGDSSSVGVGASPNKILADISNLHQQPKQYVSADQLLKEKEILVKLLANRYVVLESCKAELQRCQNDFQKLRKQNSELALTNSKMLAELNSSRQKLRELQLELGSKNGVLVAMNLELKAKKEHTVKLKHEIDAKEVVACQSKQSDQLLREDNRGNAKRKRVSKCRSSAPAVIKQVKSTEKVDNRRYSLRRQSAGLEAEKPEPTKDFLEIDEVKDDISHLQDDLAKENGPTSLGSKVHDRASEASELPTNNEQVHTKQNIQKKRQSMRRTTNSLEVDEVKDLVKENGPTSLGSEVHDTAREAHESLVPTNTEQVHAKKNIEKKRHSMRRPTNSYKPENPEPTEDFFEIDDAKFNVSELSDNMSEKICPTTSTVTSGQGNSASTFNPQESHRSSVGRPLRRSVEKIVSYKEVPLKVKMRRDKSGNMIAGSH